MESRSVAKLAIVLIAYLLSEDGSLYFIIPSSKKKQKQSDQSDSICFARHCILSSVLQIFLYLTFALSKCLHSLESYSYFKKWAAFLIGSFLYFSFPYFPVSRIYLTPIDAKSFSLNLSSSRRWKSMYLRAVLLLCIRKVFSTYVWCSTGDW